jgi:hypothetical protein
MFALPPISPVGGFARSLFGPALSLAATWSLLSMPGWIIDGQRFYAEALAPQAATPCPAYEAADMLKRAYEGDLLEAAGNGQAELSDDAILTYFNRTPNGQLVGWYQVDQNGTTYTGTLSQGQEEVMASSDAHFYHFKWRDQFGSGDADFVFSPDYKTFDGSWSSDQNTEWFSSWSGSRR